MSLVVNGTTIPTNVANALMVKGVSITSVMCNGTNVWLQSLVVINSGWSGNSIGATGYGNMGLEMSGSSWRAWWNSYGSVGGWITTTSLGTFIGNSDTTPPLAQGYTIITSGSSWYIANGAGWTTYNPSTETFTGSSYGRYGGEQWSYTETSSGLMRYSNPGWGVYGAWVSLH